MKTLEVYISEEALHQILTGESHIVEFPLLPENFFTICEMFIDGRKFYSIEEALNDDDLQKWLQENELEINPIRFDTLILKTDADSQSYAMPVEDITMTYLNDEEGNPLYTEVKGIDYRRILMQYHLKVKGGPGALRTSFVTQGTCSSRIDVEIENGIIVSVDFIDGCEGNLKGISALVRGMKVEDAISRLSGIRCGNKPTSCPDQLAHALALTIGK